MLQTGHVNVRGDMMVGVMNTMPLPSVQTGQVMFEWNGSMIASFSTASQLSSSHTFIELDIGTTENVAYHYAG